MKLTAEECRKRATEYRDLAKTTTTDWVRYELLDLARSHEKNAIALAHSGKHREHGVAPRGHSAQVGQDHERSQYPTIAKFHLGGAGDRPSKGNCS